MTIKLLALLAASAIATAASAAPITFSLAYSSAPGAAAPAATATGSITTDDSYFNAGGQNYYDASAVGAFSLTVHNSNGTTSNYSLGDFYGFVIGNPGTVDLSMELVGQAVGNGFHYGDTDGGGGDFNIFSSQGPSGFGPNSFSLNNDNFYLTSMTAAAADAVPEPAMLGLFGMGAIGLGLARRRKAA